MDAAVRLVRAPDDRARRVLGWLGTCVTVGYLRERLVRLRVRPSGFDTVETPIVVLGWGGVIAMAVLGSRAGLTERRPTRGPTAPDRPSVLGMPSRGLLVATSRAQLAAQLAGLTVALRRGRYFDLGFMRGSVEHIRRDALWNGTAYSAPGTMLLLQLWAVRRLAAGPDDLARRVLGLLGAINVPGYLSERFVRQHLRPREWDAVETPVLAASLALAAGMAVLGHRTQAGR